MSALLPEQEAFLATVPPLYRGIVERALHGGNSRANAIKTKCLDCCCYVRDEVEHCTVVLCPLHAYRPRYVRGEANSGQPDEERLADGETCLCQLAGQELAEGSTSDVLPTTPASGLRRA